MKKSGAKQDKLSYKPNLKDLQAGSQSDGDDDEYDEEDMDDLGEEGESENSEMMGS